MRASSSMLALVILVGGALLASPVGAEPTSEERLLAETLFQEGRNLMDEERWPEACRKLEASLAIEPLPGVLLNVAVCHEHEGRVATAWSEFREALALSKIDRRPDRVALAQRHIEALEPRLPHLSVRVVEPRDGMIVMDGETALPMAVWEVPRPVDPGTHLVTARAPDCQPWTSSVEIGEGADHTVIVPRLAPLPRPPGGSPAGTASPAASAPTALAPSPIAPEGASPREAAVWPTVGVSLLGLGVATTVVGAGLGVHALRLDGRADEDCSERACFSQDALDVSRRARGFATAANVTLPLGMGVAVGGILALVLGPDDGSVEVSVGPASLGVHGRF